MNNVGYLGWVELGIFMELAEIRR